MLRSSHILTRQLFKVSNRPNLRHVSDCFSPLSYVTGALRAGAPVRWLRRGVTSAPRRTSPRRRAVSGNISFLTCTFSKRLYFSKQKYFAVKDSETILYFAYRTLIT